MLDHLKTEGRQGGIARSRLSAYVMGLLVLGAILFAIAKYSSQERGPEELPEAPEAPSDEPPAPRIEEARLPQADDAAVHARWQSDALDYLLGIAEEDFAAEARRLPTAALDALPFSEARGGVFETEGVVEEIGREVYRRDSQRLWFVVLSGADGGRVVVLKHGLESDDREGRPEAALRSVTDYIETGDRLLVRGIYLQRRTGTLGRAILREPVPVLVATPPPAAFRILPEPAVPIRDLQEADWDEIRDQFLRETQYWEEDALFQVIQWAQRRGAAQIAQDLKDGALPWREWDADLFDRWGEEIELTDPDAPRPVTEGLRGKVFRTSGLIGSYVREGWEVVPRKASAWGVDQLYILDLQSDYWGNQGLRSFLAFPLETFPDLTREKGEHVRIYGVFLKNYTYETNWSREGGGSADVTMPMFVILRVEPVPFEPSPYRDLIWILSGVILLLGVAFYLVFVRGERREAERMETYRRGLRRRIREKTGSPFGPKPEDGSATSAGSDEEAPAAAEEWPPPEDGR